MSQSHFQKFTPKKKNSLVKEEFRQAKKKAKKERAAAIDRRFEEKRQLRAAAKSAPVQPAVPAKPTRENKVKTIESKFAQAQKIEAIKNDFAAPEQKTKVPTPRGPNKTGVKGAATASPQSAEMPLNKFLAHCGVCSRRDAVTLIKDGKVKVNGTVILEPAFKVTEKDDVQFNGKKLFVSKNLVYILLNKPKDYITTTDDPQGRKTVLQLTKMATTERIYPVGRLDRNTSGVLLLTNDGELTQKLSHPSYNITKVYEARLDKSLTKADFDKMRKEDGPKEFITTFHPI